ncbi:MAG: hypothetical protein M3436_20695 [Pseudomonadota bacterium]|nr:hypothetical protein [Pseudomonadota bacterium]
MARQAVKTGAKGAGTAGLGGPRTGLGGPAATAGAGGPGTAGTAIPAGSMDSSLGTEHITWGYVDSYSVDEERLMIKLVTGAIGRRLISLRADAPHFRTSVSMTMMAYHTPGTKLTVRYLKSKVAALNIDDIVYALEIGIGKDPEKTLSFDDWVIKLP